MRDMSMEYRYLADVLTGVVRRALEEADEYERGLPHVLVCSDPANEITTYSGPFRSQQAAELVAEHERRTAGADNGLVFYASPLYPPLDLAVLAGSQPKHHTDETLELPEVGRG